MTATSWRWTTRPAIRSTGRCSLYASIATAWWSSACVTAACGWHLVSDNSAHPPRPIGEDDRVIGRVAWSGPPRSSTHTEREGPPTR